MVRRNLGVLAVSVRGGWGGLCDWLWKMVWPAALFSAAAFPDFLLPRATGRADGRVTRERGTGH